MTRVLFMGKLGDPVCLEALAATRANFDEVDVFLGRWGLPVPQWVYDWRGDYIFSYLAPLVIPGSILSNARHGRINFHPGPPEYPGIGCTNFALYNNEVVFGVTCHHMLPKVDSGQIITVKRFPVRPDETVHSLTLSCYAWLIEAFYEIVDCIIGGKELPVSRETWSRRPYVRRELNELCRITPDMPADEIRRRVKAVTFPGAPGAFLELQGARFEYANEPSGPLAPPLPLLTASERDIRDALNSDSEGKLPSIELYGLRFVLQRTEVDRARAEQ